MQCEHKAGQHFSFINRKTVTNYIIITKTINNGAGKVRTSISSFFQITTDFLLRFSNILRVFTKNKMNYNNNDRLISSLYIIIISRQVIYIYIESRRIYIETLRNTVGDDVNLSFFLFVYMFVKELFFLNFKLFFFLKAHWYYPTNSNISSFFKKSFYRDR